MFDSLPQIPVHQRWREQKYPLAVVGAIIRRQGLVDNSKVDYLLILRNSDPYQGMWALVGGKWDFGETLAQAVVREVQEETGLETKFTALRGLVNERLASIDTAAPAHFTIFICELQVTAGTAREQKEGAVAWFSMSEIERLSREGRIVPTDYVMIQQFVPAAALPYAEIEVLIDGDGLATIHRIEEMAG